MEGAADPARGEVRQQPLAVRWVRHEQVVEMGRVGTVGRYRGLSDTGPLGPVGEARMIGLPDSAAAVLDLFEGLELGGEEGGQDLGGQVAGADVHPPVPSDDAAQEVAAVGTLVPDDLRSGMQAHVVDDERASLTTLHVLGFVEALGGEGSEGSETLSAVRPAKPMRIVLDQADPV